MNIPQSVLDAFEAAKAVTGSLAPIAETRLRVLCTNEHWLFDSREKSLESTLSKLEAGTESISSMTDLWAAMVVVPTLNQVDRAVAEIQNLFDGQVRQRRNAAVDAFPYDDVHVIATLGNHVTPTVASDAVRARPFEIQVRTGVQYAWWKATHDVIYKGSEVERSQGWEIRRLAGQTRAAIELVDGLLADMATSAALLQSAHPTFEPTVSIEAVQWLELWRPSDHPADVVRYAETIHKWLKATELEASVVLERLAADENRHLFATPSLSPTQVVLAILVQLLGDELAPRLLKSNIRVLVTPELELVEPRTAQFPVEVVCRP